MDISINVAKVELKQAIVSCHEDGYNHDEILAIIEGSCLQKGRYGNWPILRLWALEIMKALGYE